MLPLEWMINRPYTPSPLPSVAVLPTMLAVSFGGATRAHGCTFSRTLRLADAYSTRTLFQSQWSSSATIMAFEVSTPVPISVWLMRMVTVSSGAIVIHALISGTSASRYHG